MAKTGSDTQTLWHDYRRTGDQALRDRLILTYAPLVKFVAGRLGASLPAHVDEQDLAQVLGIEEQDRVGSEQQGVQGQARQRTRFGRATP